MSTRYNTGNPIESTDVRDMSDNAKNLDLFSNSSELSFADRLGVERQTIYGMNSEFNDQILNMGFSSVGTFSSGATLTNPRQTLLWDTANGGDGQEYGWSGTFPKIVPPSSTPSSTGGISVGAWMSRFDPELRIMVRESLRRSYAEAGYKLVNGSFEAGGVLVSAHDVLLHEVSGKAFSGPAGTVAAGTNPASGGFVDLSGVIIRNQITASSGSGLVGHKYRTVRERLEVVGYIGDYLAPATANHTVELHTAISENRIVDLEGKTLTVDYITTKSNCLIRNGNIQFTDALTSSVDNPLICGDNFVRGTNSEANYPTTKIKNATFYKVNFSNINESTYRKAIAVFMNDEDCGFYECDFSRIFGHAVRFIGNHAGTTPNTTAYDIPKPVGYSLRPKLRHCTFSSGYYHDSLGKLQLGAAIQLVACKNFDIHDCHTTDCVAGFLIDFLNYGGSVTKTSYEVTRQDFYDNIANYHDVVSLYFGQATQKTKVSGHVSYGASRIGAYFEASSFVDLYDSTFEAWPNAVGDIGVAVIANKLYPTAPDLICQGNKISRCDFLGFETPAVIGDDLKDGIDGGSLSNCNLRKRAWSAQPAVVLNRVVDFTYSNNDAKGSLFLNRLAGSKLLGNSHKVSSGNALFIKAGTYNQCTGEGNYFYSSEGKAVCAEPITGYLQFSGGYLYGALGALSGTFTTGLEFVGYHVDTPLDKSVSDKAITIPANGAMQFYETFAGAEVGDIVTTIYLSELYPNLAMSAWVNANGTVNVKVLNLSTSAFDGLIDFRITLTKFASGDYRK